jgi:hypothetical protein
MRLLSLFFICLCIGLGVGSLYAQTVTPDTMNVQQSVQDSTQKKSAASVDTVVIYSAKDSIIYSLRTRFMNLYGKSEMQYQTIGLKAERVSVNWDDALLHAQGAQQDTAKGDSIIGKPIMRDGGDEYKGDRVMYNFQTKKGKIVLGKTQMDNGYYYGDQIKKVEPDVLCVEDGSYTTCDAAHPHFYFESPKMKVFVRDKVVAEPIYFYIADVPIFPLPFGVFPAHSGRSSGIIAPAYGQDDRYGWYLSHFGYYWAASDYWDVASTFDLYSRGRWQNETNFHYALRYNFGGNLNISYSDSPEGEPNDPDFNNTQLYHINFNHYQQISPSSSLNANFTFMSGNYYKKLSRNIGEILQQNIISYATYSKTWEQSNRSLSVNVYRDQNLNTDETNERLPSISFSQGTIFPFRKRTKTRGLSSESEQEMSFVEMLGFGYSAGLENDQSKVVDSASVKTSPLAQQPQYVKDFRRASTQSLSQNLSFSISPKFGYFTVSPSFSLSDSRRWTAIETPSRNPADSLLEYKSVNTKNTVGTLSTGVNTSTRFYGLFQPNVFGVTAIRHTVTPSFGVFYNKQIYGDNMNKYSMVGSFNIGNNFEMKYQKNDSLKTEDKLQLLNMNGRVSYDFAADSMNFGRGVDVDYRTDIGQYLSVGGSANYNLYLFDPAAANGQGARVNKFILSEEGRLGDLTSMQLSLSTTFRGEKKQKPAEAGIPDDVKKEQDNVSGKGESMPGQKKMYYSVYDKEDADFSIPWNITLSYNFSESRPTPLSYSRSSSLNASLSFNLTELWQISTSGSYDFVRKEHFIPSVSVTRDLHCWQMSFSWYPMGFLEGYRFELKVKAPQLQDIKVTKQSNRSGNYY